jgi:cytochrome c biogenesis protein CcmG/thiol:disulfide interchange protein DsbE
VKFFIPVLIFVMIGIVLGKAFQLNPGTPLASTLIGQSAPSFKVSGETEAIFQGKITILNVWASWCSSCQQEHEFWVKMPIPADVQLISLNYHDDEKDAKDWLVKHGNPYQAILFDSDGHLCVDYGISGVPTTFVIDQTGIVQHRHMGVVDKAVWDNELKPLIKKLAR